MLSEQMKQIIGILTFLMFGNLILMSQDRFQLPVDENGSVTYSEVVQLPNVSGDELYNRAVDWVVRNYKSSNSVIQLNDKERKKIIGKGNFIIVHYLSNKWRINHTLTIQAKDGRYKVLIDQITISAIDMICTEEREMTGKSHPCLLAKSYSKLKIKTQNKIKSILKSIKEDLAKSTAKNGDDW